MTWPYENDLLCPLCEYGRGRWTNRNTFRTYIYNVSSIKCIIYTSAEAKRHDLSDGTPSEFEINGPLFDDFGAMMLVHGTIN